MNFKEYVIFKEAKKNSTKGKKKPEAKKPTVKKPAAKKKEEVSIEVQLDNLLLKIRNAPDIEKFKDATDEFVVKAAEYAKKYLVTYRNKYGKSIDFNDIVSTLSVKLSGFHKQDFNRILIGGLS